MLDKTANSTTYKGGDNQSVFPIPFSFIETSHIEATLVDVNGTATDLRAGIDFAINRMSDGEGEFILLGDRVLSANSRLTISRIVPLTQEILFHNQGPNSPQATEEGLDKLTMIAQQLAAAVARRLQAPEGKPPEEVVQSILDSAETVEEIQAAIEALEHGLAHKADDRHSHAWSDITGLQQRLLEKADAAATTAALAQKADRQALEYKANAQHQHAIADVRGLNENLSAIAADLSNKAERADLPGLATAAADGLLSAGDKLKLDGLDENPEGLASREYVDSELTGRDARLDTLELSRITDAPSDGAAYVRRDGQWAAATTGIVGEIRLLPFRSGNLPNGWYFCNGDRYELVSEQGRALDALPASFKTDWGIAVADDAINLPNLFNGGDGYFLRPVNNGNRLPGSRQADAIRNIAGTLLSQSGYSVGALSRGGSYPGVATGAFGKGEDTNYGPGQSTGTGNAVIFDASLVVPTASENRPLNIGMTPSIYLGV